MCDPLGQANGGQDKLKRELKNIIDDLNDNLNSMKQQVAQQARQINQLQGEKDMLGKRVKDMQAQAANSKQLKDSIAKLQHQLKGECLPGLSVHTCVFLIDYRSHDQHRDNRVATTNQQL